MKRTRDAALAEELTQETFFRADLNFAVLRETEKRPRCGAGHVTLSRLNKEKQSERAAF